MEHTKDYYQILGVSPKATSMEIRRAYRRLATLNHPDRNPSSEATLRMQEINEAYGILGDKRKRIKYDSEGGSSTAASPTTSSPGTTPVNLQQIHAEELAPQIRFLSRIAIPVLLVLALSSVYGSWTTSQPVFTILAVFILILGGNLVFLMNLLKSSEIETRCPRCHKFGAAKQLKEELTDVFQKRHFILGFLRLNVPAILITFERYKRHYRCKHCSYEWAFLYTKRQSPL